MSWIEELRGLLRRVTKTHGPEDLAKGVECHEAAERVFEWLDGELNPGLHEAIGAHLETCARCYPMLAFERSFLEAVSRVSGREKVSEALRGRILRSLEIEGFSAS